MATRDENGVVFPSVGDRGAALYHAMDNNFTLLSALIGGDTQINVAPIPVVAQDILSDNWVDVNQDETGLYEQTVLMPETTPGDPSTQLMFDEVAIHFRLPTGTGPVYLDFDRLSDSSYKLYSNSIRDFKAIYI